MLPTADTIECSRLLTRLVIVSHTKFRLPFVLRFVSWKDYVALGNCVSRVPKLWTFLAFWFVVIVARVNREGNILALEVADCRDSACSLPWNVYTPIRAWIPRRAAHRTLGVTAPLRGFDDQSDGSCVWYHSSSLFGWISLEIWNHTMRVPIK